MPVGKDVKLGKNVKIYNPKFVNLYGCEIGKDCIIGSFVEIRRKVKIGNRVKIQAFAFIPENVTIEDEAFIGPHVCFINDLYPRSVNYDGTLKTPRDWRSMPTYIGKRVSIGANATILCGITIGKGAIIGAGSVVTRNVSPYVIVAGNPARVIRKIDKTI
ncbi:MAG: acyltransferase [Candidatus Levybacteria bacterium]|nr:acyltransferase [Candidatus Levybacteria bacterium]